MYLDAGYSAKCCEKLANSPAYLSKTFFMRPVFRFIKHNLSIYYLFYAVGKRHVYKFRKLFTQNEKSYIPKLEHEGQKEKIAPPPITVIQKNNTSITKVFYTVLVRNFDIYHENT